MANKKPVHQIRFGAIKAAIWKNTNGNNSSWFSVTLRRSYKDGDEWSDTDSLRRDDLPIAEKALGMAYAWIWDQHNAPSPEQAKQ